MRTKKNKTAHDRRRKTAADGTNEKRARERDARAMLMRASVMGVLLLILIGSIALVSAQVRHSKAKKAKKRQDRKN